MIPMNRDLRRRLAAGALAGGMIAAPAIILSPQVALLWGRAGIERPSLITDPSLAMFMMAKMAMARSGPAGPPGLVDLRVDTYTTQQLNVSVSKPDGATRLMVEAIGGGGSGVRGQVQSNNISMGGGGGAYSRTNSYDVEGISVVDIYIAVGADTTVRETNSSGTIICMAQRGRSNSPTNQSPGGSASSGVGDVKYSGGAGGAIQNFNSTFVGGGGAAGPDGDGTWGGSNVAGTGGGSPAGNGGTNENSFAGNNYGGGGAGKANVAGAGTIGWLRLTWRG